MELQISDLENSINNQVRQSMEKAQRIFLARKIALSTMSWVIKGIEEEEQKNYELS